MLSQMPDVHVYGADHSPWVQSVLIALEIKAIPYTLHTSPGVATMVASLRQGVPSVITMPALWYDGQCFFDSRTIIQMLDQRHPEPSLMSYTPEAAEDLRQLQQLFVYAPAFRTAGLKNFVFFYTWSIMHDTSSWPTSLTRPFVALWMFTKITLAKHIRIGARNLRNIADTSIGSSLQYFDELLRASSGPFLRGNRITYTDAVLLGHFQCMFCGLSDEVLQVVDKYPALWEWLRTLHQSPALGSYQRLYTKRHPEVSARLQTAPTVDMPLFGVARSQVLFWIGAVCMVALAPITVVAIAMVMLASNPNPNSGSKMAFKTK